MLLGLLPVSSCQTSGGVRSAVLGTSTGLVSVWHLAIKLAAADSRAGGGRNRR